VSFQDQFFLLKYSALESYCRMASTEDTKFPVFFPVSREFGWRKVRTRLHPPPAGFFDRPDTWLTNCTDTQVTLPPLGEVGKEQLCNSE
jgi:hypothetical protein